MTHCPACGRLWFHTINGSGCLTPGCSHSLIRRDKKSTGKKSQPKRTKEK